ncbi:GIN domain-containing protein [Mucilaginibacter sp. NFX135]|uniref:GIN domain-containing protein n=1 Tax=Mucilaginibacter sp. NFX135 TaxID=3402687 RepID=UPI003AFB3663
MKTLAITLFTVAAIVFGIGNQAQATVNTNNNKGIVLTDITRINQIEVYGNVQVYVSNGTADEVKVYNRYYAESALVQAKNGVLRISSYNKAEKLVVWVTAKQLSGITAYDNANISSFGNFSAIELDVKLYNNASATLKLDVYSARVTMNDKACANLSGTVNEFSLNRSYGSSVNGSNLVAEHTTEVLNSAKVKADEYAGL